MNIGSQDCLFIDDNEIEITNVQKVVPGIQGIHFDSSIKLRDSISSITARPTAQANGLPE